MSARMGVCSGEAMAGMLPILTNRARSGSRVCLSMNWRSGVAAVSMACSTRQPDQHLVGRRGLRAERMAQQRQHDDDAREAAHHQDDGRQKPERRQEDQRLHGQRIALAAGGACEQRQTGLRLCEHGGRSAQQRQRNQATEEGTHVHSDFPVR
ncbi:hypothetical protein DL770_011389 [Monosporascus sp. CRB-9-2]|nr:hypothetical protein DL770_011389 [Monosporascus sp. CRB-9-2]